MESWPFEDPENVWTMTVQQITHGGQPILRVCHAENGMWQFLTGRDPVRRADAMLVSIRKVYTIDPSIAEVADLPMGWTAERSAPGQPWQRKPAC